MTSQGSAHGRFTRAIKTRNVFMAEVALRELGTRNQVSLSDALEYVALLADVRPDRMDVAAVRWHARFEAECVVTLAESQLALSALVSLRAGDQWAVTVLRGLLRRARPLSAVRRD